MGYGTDTLLKIVDEQVIAVVSALDSESPQASQNILANNLDFIKLEFPLIVALNGKNAIVDIETSGFIPYGKVVTFGCIFKGKMVIIQRLKSGAKATDAFMQEIRHYLEDMADFDKYAFCCMFEQQFLGAYHNWKEIQPKCGGKKDDIVKFKHFHFGEGSDVPGWWKKWKNSKDVVALRSIIVHNANCLIKEMAILSASDNNVL
jgi:hypothetical protein